MNFALMYSLCCLFLLVNEWVINLININKIIAYALIYGTLFSVNFAQLFPGDWRNLPSYMEVSDLTSHMDMIYMTSNSGLILFDSNCPSSSGDDLENKVGDCQINLSDNLLNRNLNSILIEDEYLIVSANGDFAQLQFLNPVSYEIIDTFENPEITKIQSMSIQDSMLFAVFHDRQNCGILKFQKYEDTWDYKDYYIYFPEDVSNIGAIDVFADSLTFLANGKQFTAHLNDNLKSPDAWSSRSFPSSAVDFSVLENEMFVLCSEGIWNSWSVEYSNFDFDSEFRKIKLNNTGVINLITDYKYYKLSEELQILNELECAPFGNAKFLEETQNGNYVYLQHAGLCHFGESIPEIGFYPIKSLLQNNITAITVDNYGKVFALGSHGINIIEGDELAYIIPESTIERFPTYLPNQAFPLSIAALPFLFGSQPSISLTHTLDGDLFFTNIGVQPGTHPQRAGAIQITLPELELELYDTTASVFDGLDGIYNSAWDNSYLTIRQAKRGPFGNLWVLNPYSETRNHIAAIQIAESNEWVHVQAGDSTSYLPTEIAFNGRTAWFGFQHEATLDNSNQFMYSDGRIKIVDFGNIDDPNDDEWIAVSNFSTLEPEFPGENVFSLVFDDHNILWILSENGMNGYQVTSGQNGRNLRPVYQQNLFRYIPFIYGDKIRVDKQNNKWICTRHSGVRVVTESMEFWPDEGGFTSDNSELASDVVNDIVFDTQNGLAIFATDAGISYLKLAMGFPNSSENVSLSISPNPFHISGNNSCSISNCIPNGQLRILDLTSQLIQEIPTNLNGLGCDTVPWDGRNRFGDFVATGVYLLISSHENGEKRVGKIAVINE